MKHFMVVGALFALALASAGEEIQMRNKRSFFGLDSLASLGSGLFGHGSGHGYSGYKTYSGAHSFRSSPSVGYQSYAGVPAVSGSGYSYSAPSYSYSGPASSFGHAAPATQLVEVKRVVNVNKVVSVPQVVNVRRVISVPQVVTEKKLVAAPSHSYGSYDSGYGNGYGSSYGDGYGSTYAAGYGSNYAAGYGSSYGSSEGSSPSSAHYVTDASSDCDHQWCDHQW